jgi:hypothetical protein
MRADLGGHQRAQHVFDRQTPCSSSLQDLGFLSADRRQLQPSQTGDQVGRRRSGVSVHWSVVTAYALRLGSVALVNPTEAADLVGLASARHHQP